MDNNVYLFETIEDCKKCIVDKSINIDIAYQSNIHLFECFVRTVRTVMIWIIVSSAILIWINFGFNNFIINSLIQLIIYSLGCILMSWVKFNYKASYNKAKINFVDNMISRCKEFKETEYEEWEIKQIISNMANLANIDVNWGDNDK